MVWCLAHYVIIVYALLKEAQKDPTSFTDLVRRLLRKCETELQRVRSALLSSLFIFQRLFLATSLRQLFFFLPFTAACPTI